MSPSPSPIARCMGCMSSKKAVKGRGVTPEIAVSRETEKAPSCMLSTAPSSEALTMRFLLMPPFMTNCHNLPPRKQP